MLVGKVHCVSGRGECSLCQDWIEIISNILSHSAKANILKEINLFQCGIWFNNSKCRHKSTGAGECAMCPVLAV